MSTVQPQERALQARQAQDSVSTVQPQERALQARQAQGSASHGALPQVRALWAHSAPVLSWAHWA